MASKNDSDSALFRRVLFQIRPFWPHLVGIFLLRLLATPLGLLLPVPVKIAVDSVIGTDPLPDLIGFFVPDSVETSRSALLLFAVGLQVLVVLFSHLQSLAVYVFRSHTGERMTLSFREKLFRHVQRLSFLFHDSRGTADSVYRIQYDAPSVQYLTIYQVIPSITALITLCSMIYVTARFNFQLACVAMGVAPFLFLISRTYNVRMRGKYKDIKKQESRVLGIVQEVMNAARVVKAFGREDSESERFKEHSSKTIKARVRISFAEGGLGLLINLVIGVGTALVLYIGVRDVQAGMLTLGELLMILGYLTQLYGPMETLSKNVGQVQSSLASVQRAFELLDQVPDVLEKPNARPLKRARGDIEAHSVSFSYNRSQPVLNNISFRIPAGTRVGIVGRTGVGKTTLASLLSRFYDPGKGRILLDGVDLSDYKLADLRNQFSLVLQEPVLFSTSISENIAYGRPDADGKEIEEAAMAANAHEFIVNLSEGYNTLVGERGMCLSGGERQRIALARAFLKDAPVLILDEPTSSVDVQTEAAIMDAMERLMVGRTVFMIAHRLGTLENCDLWMEIQDGGTLRIESEEVYTR